VEQLPVIVILALMVSMLTMEFVLHAMNPVQLVTVVAKIIVPPVMLAQSLSMVNVIVTQHVQPVME
jgi:hypothetical protein